MGESEDKLAPERTDWNLHQSLPASGSDARRVGGLPQEQLVKFVTAGKTPPELGAKGRPHTTERSQRINDHPC